MGKIGIIDKLSGNKKTICKVGIAVIVVIVVAVGGKQIFTGDKAVDYKVLAEKDIPQQITSQVIPEYRQLERALACVVDDKIYVVACRGEKPTSGYDISVKKMTVSEEDGLTTLTVYTEFKDPEPGTALTQTLTYPLKVAEVELDALPDNIDLKVQYAN